MTTKFICEYCGKEYSTEEACKACEETCVKEIAEKEAAEKDRAAEIETKRAAIEDLMTDINVTEQDLSRQYDDLRKMTTEFIDLYPDESISVSCPKFRFNTEGKRIPFRPRTPEDVLFNALADSIGDIFGLNK